LYGNNAGFHENKPDGVLEFADAQQQQPTCF